MLNSRLTINGLIERLARKIGEPAANINKTLALDAINQGLNIYYNHLRDYKPERLRKVVQFDVPESGFDLTTITFDYTDVNAVTTQRPAFGTYHMTVWSNCDQIIPEVAPESPQYGYYLLQDTIYLTQRRSDTLTVVYELVTPRLTTEDQGFDFATTIVPIDQDIEFGFEEYVAGYYKRAEGEDDGGALSYQHSMDLFQKDLDRLFRYRMKPMAWRTPRYRRSGSTGSHSVSSPTATEIYRTEELLVPAALANTNVAFVLANTVDTTYPPDITINGVDVQNSSIITFSGTDLVINVNYPLNTTDCLKIIYRQA